MLDARQLERWLYGAGTRQRRTQDSPIMPDVWFAYGAPDALGDEQPLEGPLVAPGEGEGELEPRTETDGRSGPVWEADLLLRPDSQASAGQLARAVAARLDRPRAETLLAYNDAYVACRLRFDELLREALPLSRFWQTELWPGAHGPLGDLLAERVDELVAHYGADEPRRQGRHALQEGEIPGNVIWLVGLVGRIAWELWHGRESPSRLPSGQEVVAGGLELLGGVELGRQPEGAPLISVSRNRPVLASVWRSRIACKADAATRLFGLSCRDVRWAVIDSGVDARHPAFARRVAQAPVETDGQNPKQSGCSRVAGTWDFSKIRAVLSGTAMPGEASADPASTPDAGERVVLTLREPDADEAGRIEKWLTRGREVDWDAIAPLLAIAHDDTYAAPRDDHGTHVAGILAADWRPEDRPSPGEHHVQGVCPDIELYDLRAFDADGGSDEFSILSAMQFVRHLNAHADRPVVHGVNLSFSVRHEVAKYAAGRTPVCEEAHRLVGSGVVVVAAAGNDGRGGYVVKGRSVEGYRTVSITDPGNAERVITVGATHRDLPHTYGVSYFSSRGPTGDGRAKPDLVAPGEKITAPVPDGGLQSKDGTSQAAPHVSGVCALLLARHPELIGQPDRVKEVLMHTCTDLGREPAFQGAGMVDVLRAIQAV